MSVNSSPRSSFALSSSRLMVGWAPSRGASAVAGSVAGRRRRKLAGAAKRPGIHARVHGNSGEPAGIRTQDTRTKVRRVADHGVTWWHSGSTRRAAPSTCFTAEDRVPPPWLSTLAVRPPSLRTRVQPALPSCRRKSTTASGSTTRRCASSPSGCPSRRGRRRGPGPRSRPWMAGRVERWSFEDLRCGCGPRHDSFKSRTKAKRS